MSLQHHSQRLNLRQLHAMRERGEPIACLTAYEYAQAQLADAAGVDVVLVGDSLGMVVQGHETTVPVTVEDIVYHTQAVARGLSRAWLIADMPFMSYVTLEHALDTAACLMQDGGAQMVKLEGDAQQQEIVASFAAHGIPVCAHLGLRPQLVHKLGGYRVQGREDKQAEQMLADALTLQQAGADMLLLECVPSALASRIQQEVQIPVIGIGAGSDCDGQILVLHDVLGMTASPPKFTQDFLQGRGSIQEALSAYVAAVKSREFPAAAQSFS